MDTFSYLFILDNHSRRFSPKHNNANLTPVDINLAGKWKFLDGERGPGKKLNNGQPLGTFLTYQLKAPLGT